MMASEPSDDEDFVRRAVWAVQAEQARIRIGDSTEGRDGLEPVFQQITAGEGERVKRRRQGRSPAEEGRGKPRRGGPVKGSPRAEGIHELRERGRGRRNSPLRVFNSGGGISAQHLSLRTGESFQEDYPSQDVD